MSAMPESKFEACIQQKLIEALEAEKTAALEQIEELKRERAEAQHKWIRNASKGWKVADSWRRRALVAEKKLAEMLLLFKTHVHDDGEGNGND